MRPLSPRRINMGLVLLGAIMETAVERDLIRRNPAKGKGRRLREHRTRRSYLETVGQVQALLDAAGELDSEAASNRKHVHRRAMLATLAFAGLRIGELLRLRWRDVDLANGWLTVQESKTDAGRRKVKIRGALRDELLAVRTRVQPDGIVFATSNGRRLSAENFRNRVLAAAIKPANENLAEQDLPPLPAGITPHSLRRTFASLLYAVGESPRTVMDELGHTDEGLR
jgi:integrase